MATDRRPDDAPARSRDDAAMLVHCEESATTKTAPFRRNPLGAGGFGPQALSLVGRDAKTAPAASVSNLGARSSLRACNPKTPARGPRDFCHGLLRVSYRKNAKELSSENLSVVLLDNPNNRGSNLKGQ